ncbi:MAG: hypothetical protein ACLUI3_11465 [Christensenellales bacterium]
MRYDVLLCDADNTLFDLTRRRKTLPSPAGDGLSSTPSCWRPIPPSTRRFGSCRAGKIEQSVLQRRFEQFWRRSTGTATRSGCDAC